MIITSDGITIDGELVSTDDLTAAKNVTGDIQTQLDDKVDHNTYTSGLATKGDSSTVDLKAPLASPTFTGNVGIGTTSPQQKLEVNGRASIIDKLVAKNIYSYNVGINLSTPHTLRQSDGNTWIKGCNALVIVGFSSGTSSSFMTTMYLVTYNGSNTNSLIHIAGNAGASSNRPYMDITNGYPTVKTNHSGTYTYGVTVIRADNAIG